MMIRELQAPVVTALPRLSKELSKMINSTFLLKVTWKQARNLAAHMRKYRPPKVPGDTQKSIAYAVDGAEARMLGGCFL